VSRPSVIAGVEYPLRPVRADAAQALPLVHPGRWAFEPKWDGFRCIAFRGPERAVLQSRQQRPLPRYFPEIAGAVSELDREVVVDGELVVWHEGRLDFAALQQRIHPADARARQLSIARPASYIVFDLLARDGVDLRPLPYRKRRKKLEKLLSDRLPHGLVLMPMSTDRAVAQAWMLDHSAAGIEGVVAKRLDQSYRGRGRTWQKIRTRRTAEAIVGGVLGTLEQLDALVVGRCDSSGRLRISGRTGPLSPPARAEVRAVLAPSLGAHPWPEVIPSSRFGQRPSQPVEYTRVVPSLVVELDVDTAFEHHRWRHAARLVRVRRDLGINDLSSLTW
jgi:ATP-dependent DNA ligase